MVLIGDDGRSSAELGLAALTILLSWAMIHTTFALHYAHDYYRGNKPDGLDFPGGEAPDYWDFVYLAFVIGTTAQNIRCRHYQPHHSPHRHRTRPRVIFVQHGVPGADGEHRGERDLAALNNSNSNKKDRRKRRSF